MSHVSLLRRAAVLERTSLTRADLYRKMKTGEFPLPVSLGRRCVAWRDDEISAWIDSRTKRERKQGGQQ